MSPPSPPSAQLLSLPSELLSQILSHLPIQDVIALSRCCRYLTPFVNDEDLWTDLALRLPRYYGELPLVAPCHDDLSSYLNPEWEDWTGVKGIEGEMRRHARLKEKVDMILARGDEARWRLVRSVTVAQRPGATTGICQILAHTQPNLRTLVLEGPGLCSRENMWMGQSHQSLGALLVLEKLSFPALTTLSVKMHCTPFHDLLNPIYLCQLAPNLTSLDIDATQSNDLPLDKHQWVPDHYEPTENPPTHLRYLRIKYLPIRCYHHTPQSDVENNILFYQLLSRSPELQQLHMECGLEDQADRRWIAEGMVRYSVSLRDLYISSLYFDQMLEHFDEGGPESVRRLAIKSSGWHAVEMLNFSATLPLNTEELYFVEMTSEQDEYDPGYRMTPRPYTQCMLPNLIQVLENSPRLRFLGTATVDDDIDVFQQLDDPGCSDAQGFVHSYRNAHDEMELFHLHMLLDHAEILDTDRFTDRIMYSRDETDQITDIRCSDYRGNNHIRSFFLPVRSTWQTFTDYDMLAVPLEIIEMMRVVQGASEEEWKGRGVEVRDEAWAVLVNWHDTVLAAFKESDEE